MTRSERVAVRRDIRRRKACKQTHTTERITTMTDTKTKSVQVANEKDGSYNVHKPLPYPFHIDADGSVLRQDFWKGEPSRLIGFQENADVQKVDLLAETWLASDDEAPEGWYPVFMDDDGGFWNHAYPIMKRDSDAD
jgi:hypothetical protein